MEEMTEFETLKANTQHVFVLTWDPKCLDTRECRWAFLCSQTSCQSTFLCGDLEHVINPDELTEAFFKKEKEVLIKVPKVAVSSALECFEILFSKEFSKNEAKLSVREVGVFLICRNTLLTNIPTPPGNGKGRWTVERSLFPFFFFHILLIRLILIRHATPSIQRTVGNYICSTSAWESARSMFPLWLMLTQHLAHLSNY